MILLGIHLITTFEAKPWRGSTYTLIFSYLVGPRWRIPDGGSPMAGPRRRAPGGGPPTEPLGNDKLGCNSSSLTFMRWVLIFCRHSCERRNLHFLQLEITPSRLAHVVRVRDGDNVVILEQRGTREVRVWYCRYWVPDLRPGWRILLSFLRTQEPAFLAA